MVLNKSLSQLRLSFRLTLLLLQDRIKKYMAKVKEATEKKQGKIKENYKLYTVLIPES